MTLAPHTYPVARSLAYRVCEAFRRRLVKVAALTTGQIADQFGAAPRDVTTYLAGAVQHGWLERDNIGQLQHAYSTGRALRALMQADATRPASTPATPEPTPAPPPSPAPIIGLVDIAAPQTKQRSGPKRSGPTLTQDQLLVRTGVPAPKHGGRVRVVDYIPIFDALTAADISVDFPIDHLRGVRYAARLRTQAQPGQRFAIGLAHDNTQRGRITRLA